MSAKSSSKSSRSSASIFYFKWTTTTLDAYMDTIKKNFLRVLSCHCTRSRSGDEDASKEFDFSELGKNPRIVKDDREDIRKRLLDAKYRLWTNGEAKPERPITLLELSAHHRLRTLIKMCEMLKESMAKMSKWLDENKKAFSKAQLMNDIFDYVSKMFQSVCAIGEVFHLTSVNWMSSKHSDMLNPGAKEYVRAENEFLDIGASADDYCPKLSSQINYFRTLVHVIGCSYEGFLEILFLTIDPERCEVRQREIKMILKELPPQYIYAKDILEFSPRTAKLLENPPKNAFNFLMKPLKDLSDRSSDWIAINSKKSSKVTSSKYSHGRTGDGNSTRPLKKSAKSEDSHRSEKSKSKSKSKTKKSVRK